MIPLRSFLANGGPTCASDRSEARFEVAMNDAWSVALLTQPISSALLAARWRGSAVRAPEQLELTICQQLQRAQLS
jgi:hypothetical protein